MLYLLKFQFHFGDFKNPRDQKISSLMVDYWVNFATTGNPNQRTTHYPMAENKWESFTLESHNILKINQSHAV